MSGTQLLVTTALSQAQFAIKIMQVNAENIVTRNNNIKTTHMYNAFAYKIIFRKNP